MQRLCGLLAVFLILAPGPLLADDLTGAEKILCTSAEATLCTADGICESSPPWELNIPSFILVDFAAKELGTTEASGEARKTEILNVTREHGLIVLQGYQDGRAFSFVITEKAGMATIAVARDGLTVTVFGACTPSPLK